MVRRQTRAQKRNRRQQNKSRRNNRRQNKSLRRKRQSRRKLRGGGRRYGHNSQGYFPLQHQARRHLYERNKNIAKQQIINMINHFKDETQDEDEIISRLRSWNFSFGRISDFFPDEDEIRDLIYQSA